MFYSALHETIPLIFSTWTLMDFLGILQTLQYIHIFTAAQIFGTLHEWYNLWEELRQLQPSGTAAHTKEH